MKHLNVDTDDVRAMVDAAFILIEQMDSDKHGEAFAELLQRSAVRHAKLVGEDATVLILIAGVLTMIDRGIGPDLQALIDSNDEANTLLMKLRGQG